MNRQQLEEYIGKAVQIELKKGYKYYGTVVDISEEAIVLKTNRYGRTYVAFSNIAAIIEKETYGDEAVE